MSSPGATGPFDATNGRSTLTISASNTWGPWVEQIASTSEAANHIIASVRGGWGSNACANEFGIATGSLGSETQFIDSLVRSGKGSGANEPSHTFPIPMSVASTERVSARYRADENRSPCYFALSLLAGGLGYNSYDSIVTISDAEGPAIDPGTTVNTKGAWVQLNASSANAYSAVLVMFNIGNNGNVDSDYNLILDIATGSSGSQVIVPGLENIPLKYDTGEATSNSNWLFEIPEVSASTEWWARTSTNNVTSADRIPHLGLIGFYNT